MATKDILTMAHAYLPVHSKLFEEVGNRGPYNLTVTVTVGETVVVKEFFRTESAARQYLNLGHAHWCKTVMPVYAAGARAEA